MLPVQFAATTSSPEYLDFLLTHNESLPYLFYNRKSINDSHQWMLSSCHLTFEREVHSLNRLFVKFRFDWVEVTLTGVYIADR